VSSLSKTVATLFPCFHERWYLERLTDTRPHSYVQINQIWDRISKSLICLVDAWLNWFFLKNVKVRLVQEAGLEKYRTLVDFNTKLVVLSVLLDVSVFRLRAQAHTTSMILCCHAALAYSTCCRRESHG